MSDQQHTFTYEGDHRPYHTDSQTADLLRRAKEWHREAYDDVFRHGRSIGRIAEGPALVPQHERTSAPGAFARRGQEIRKELATPVPPRPERTPNVGD